jgi:hypothetical protein
VFPAVQALRDQKAIRNISPAQGKGLDPAARFPVGEAPPKVGLQTAGGLVPVLGVLGKQLHHDRGHGLRDPGYPFVRRRRLPRHVTMDPLEGLGCRERPRSRQHLVEGDPTGVQVAARIDRPIHAPGLLRGHVGERPGDDGGRLGGLSLVLHARREAESREPDPTGDDVREHVRGLEVSVDQAALVKPLESRGQPHRHAQEGRRLPGGPQVRGQQPGAGIFDRQPSVGSGEVERPGRPDGIQLVAQAVRMGELLQGRGRRLGLRRRHHQPRQAGVRIGLSREDELPVVPHDLPREGRRCHGARPPGRRHSCRAPPPTGTVAPVVRRAPAAPRAATRSWPVTLSPRVPSAT